MNYYILKDKKPVALDLNGYLAYLEEDRDFDDARQVAKDDVGRYRVSTVFLPIDHSFTVDSEPVLFETMIFGAGERDPFADPFCERYCTYEEALAGHTRVLEALKSGKTPQELNSND